MDQLDRAGRFAELTTEWLTVARTVQPKELEASIRHLVETWNEDPRPFIWHKSADEILDTLGGYCVVDL